jgi:hypothetical protein
MRWTRSAFVLVVLATGVDRVLIAMLRTMIAAGDYSWVAKEPVDFELPGHAIPGPTCRKDGASVPSRSISGRVMVQL